MMCLLVDTCGCMEVNALCLSRLRHFYLMQWQVVRVGHKVEEHIIDIEVELNNH